MKMNNTVPTNNNKVTPINTDINFYYWMTKSIDKLKVNGNTSRILIVFMIVWNILLTLWLGGLTMAYIQYPFIDDNNDGQQVIATPVRFELEPVPDNELKGE